MFCICILTIRLQEPTFDLKTELGSVAWSIRCSNNTHKFIIVRHSCHSHVAGKSSNITELLLLTTVKHSTVLIKFDVRHVWFVAGTCRKITMHRTPNACQCDIIVLRYQWIGRSAVRYVGLNWFLERKRQV